MGQLLRPCRAELYQQFLRACFIAQTWTHAHLKVPNANDASEYDWTKVDNNFKYTWFTEGQLPASVVEITMQPEQGGNFCFLFSLFFVSGSA